MVSVQPRFLGLTYGLTVLAEFVRMFLGVAVADNLFDGESLCVDLIKSLLHRGKVYFFLSDL